MRRLHALLVASSVAILISSCNGRSDGKREGAVLTSIAVQPASQYMMAGTSRQFTAVGTYSDNMSGDVTALVSWSTSDTAKAAVGNEEGAEGTVTALDGGSAEITASAGGVSGSAKVQVMSITTAPSHIVFASKAMIRTDAVDRIDTVDYRIRTKPGYASKDVNVSYSLSYLAAHGHVDNVAGTVSVPIVGLYAGYGNDVDVTIGLDTGETITTLLEIQTAAHKDSRALTGVTVNKRYMDPYTSYILFDATDTPVVVDIDGETRWQFGKTGVTTGPVHLDNDFLLVGDTSNNNIFRIDPRGEVTETLALADPRYIRFHHMFDPGKQGIFGIVQYREGPINRLGSVLVEFSTKAELLGEWDFDEIVGDAIRAAGENPRGFVENGVDWFHMNSSAYSARDDSILASSRENFVIKVDYSTKKIKWILGDTGKMWYQNYPLSLRPLALRVYGKAPIGQHTVTVVDSGTDRLQQVLLFNNGMGNRNLPYLGDDRSYSAVSLYEIDEDAMTATEIWTFDNNQEIYAPSCSSVQKTAAGEFLIDFAATDGARIFVVDAAGTVKFNMKVPKRATDAFICETAAKVREIKLENMQLR